MGAPVVMLAKMATPAMVQVTLQGLIGLGDPPELTRVMFLVLAAVARTTETYLLAVVAVVAVVATFVATGVAVGELGV